MGGVLNACKSTIGKSKTTPETINESHLTHNDKEYQVTRGLHDEFLKNTEDLIQEITTNSKWQHHEVRYLLSQFRKLGESKDATNLTQPQFIQFLPVLLKSFTNNTNTNNNDLAQQSDDNDKDQNLDHLESNKLYKKWLKHFIKLFSTSSDQITFQSFANTLSTACRGENKEKAELLFDIFDIDGDEILNDSELDLFLHYILNIDSNNDNDKDNINAFDINKIIIKAQFIEYIHDLISPPKKGKKSEDKTATNGQSTNGTESNDNDNGEDENGDNDEDIDNDKENMENVDSVDKPTEDNDNNIVSDTSSEKLEAEYEKIPLKNGKHKPEIPEDMNANIDFLANMSLSDLKHSDDLTLLNTIQKLMKNKLSSNKKLKKKNFIAFASRSINFENLFASFMIIPTRDDECRIIKELMQDTSMTMGASWFVLNKKWWDKWCSYTGYTEEKTNGNDQEKDKDEGFGTNTMNATNVRAMRPIKISNRELLDEDSYFTVLKRDLQQNNEFILIPKGAWQQLHEWYGGGPSIERFVICTDKEMRLKALNKLLPKLEFEYDEQERLMKEAMKKKETITEKEKR